MLPGAELAGRTLHGDGDGLRRFALYSLTASRPGWLLIT